MSAGATGTPAALFKTMRPQQWVKNLFVVAPLVFAKHLLDPWQALRALAAFALFCLASGAVYVINDLLDREVDRLHPTKRSRPIPSGVLKVSVARTFAVVLGVLTLTGSAAMGLLFTAFLAGYLVLNLVYSARLKRVPYVDALSIAAGFLLRVLAGAAALKVEASVWLIVCTGLLAAFLALGKRGHELAALGDAVGHRAVLARYRLSHIKIAMILLGAATVTAYVFYTLSPHTLEFFGTRHLVWTSIFPVLGLLRFGQLVLKHHQAESPTDEMLRDGWFLANVLLWGLAVIGIIYVYPG